MRKLEHRMGEFRTQFRYLYIFFLFTIILFVCSFVITGCLFSPSGEGSAPEVSIVEPTNGDTVNTEETCIEVEVKSVEDIVKVKFFDGNYFIGESYREPYTYLWNTACVSNGTHELLAEAIDASGNSGKSPSISVFVTKDSLYDWNKIDSPVTTDLNCIFTIDSSNIWICGDDGVLLYYHNSKFHIWEPSGKFINNLNDLYFLSYEKGFCVGDNIMLEFSDGNWNIVLETSTKNQLNAVFMVDDSSGWAGNKSGVIFYFEGDSLQEYGLLGSNPITDIAGFSSEDIWAACGNSLFHYNGNEWTNDSVFAGEQINALFVLNTEIWAAGTALFLYNGNYWEKCALPSTLGDEFEINSLYFSSSNKGAACGLKISESFVVEFADNKWFQKTVPGDVSLCDINIFDNGEGWAIGSQGLILHSSAKDNR